MSKSTVNPIGLTVSTLGLCGRGFVNGVILLVVYLVVHLILIDILIIVLIVLILFRFVQVWKIFFVLFD